jgi:demethylmenaquinone methyltransferase / 2-methoxy-6-polyprenyl-1,4-benzoquinol methylase
LKLIGIARSQVRREEKTGNSAQVDRKARFVMRLFSRGPGEYDFLLKILSLGRDRHWRDSVVRLAKPRRNSMVLDIACGPGTLSYQIAKAGAFVVGVDITREMLMKAKEVEGYRVLDVCLVQARSESLPLRSDTFGAATISLAMRNVSSQEEALREMRRCVMKGSNVICLDFARPKSSFFRPFYYFYIFKLLPSLGLVVSRHWNTILSYLANSIYLSRDPEQIAETMELVGLREGNVRRMTHGTVAIVSGTK